MWMLQAIALAILLSCYFAVYKQKLVGRFSLFVFALIAGYLILYGLNYVYDFGLFFNFMFLSFVYPWIISPISMLFFVILSYNE